MDHFVFRCSTSFQREIEAAELELNADDCGIQDPERLLEQFLPGLVSVHDYKCVRHMPSVVGIFRPH